jgi:type IV pilus assembly protein PilM
MASSQTIWGIDVGKSALKAIRLRALTDGLVEVVGQTYIEHDSILTDDAADRDLKVTQALEKFLSQNDISADKVVVSVPGQHTLARFSPLPPVEAKKIPDLVRYEADQQIPFDMDEVIWDYQTFQEEGAPEIQVGIFAMKRELIRDYLSHFEAAGIEPVIVQAAPLALYSAALFDGMIGDGTTVLINIGTESTDLILAGRDTLWTRSIPIGGNNFTEALVKAFKLSFTKAENLKKQAATSKYARRIFQAMRPVFADLVQELQRSIGRYTSAHRDAVLTKVIGVGNAFSLPVLQKYLQQNLQLEVEHPDTFDKIQMTPNVDSDEFKANLPNFAVAYGLALQGLGLAKIETNLLPPEIARQVEWRKKRPFFGAAAACLLLASGIIWLRYSWDQGALAQSGASRSVTSVEQAQDYISQPQSGDPAPWVKGLLSAADKLRTEYNTMKNGGIEEARRIDEMIRLQKNKALVPRILEVIHKALPVPNDAALAKADTPDAYAAAIRALRDKGVSRTNRDQVFIEGLSIRYVSDVAAEPDPSIDIVSGDNPDMIEQMPPDAQGDGFIVELRGRTTHADRAAVFINRTLQKRLREVGREPGMGFFINRVGITSMSPVTAKKAPSAPAGGPAGKKPPSGVGGRSGMPPAGGAPGPGTGRGRGGYGVGGGFTGGGSSPPPPSASGEDGYVLNVCPITEESMDYDWEFTISLDVVLGTLEPEAEGETDEFGEEPATN